MALFPRSASLFSGKLWRRCGRGARSLRDMIESTAVSCETPGNFVKLFGAQPLHANIAAELVAQDKNQNRKRKPRDSSLMVLVRGDCGRSRNVRKMQPNAGRAAAQKRAESFFFSCAAIHLENKCARAFVCSALCVSVSMQKALHLNLVHNFPHSFRRCEAASARGVTLCHPLGSERPRARCASPIARRIRKD